MTDAKSVVVLTTGAFESAENLDELERRFSMGRSSEFVRVEDLGGGQHLVNLAQVVEIREPTDEVPQPRRESMDAI